MENREITRQDSLGGFRLEPRKLLQIKLFNLLSLKPFLNDEQKKDYEEVLDLSQNISESGIRNFISSNVDTLINKAREQKRAFLNNNF